MEAKERFQQVFNYLDEKKWKRAMFDWAERLNEIIVIGKFPMKYLRIPSKIVKVAKKLGEEEKALEMAHDLLFASNKTFYDRGVHRKRYPALARFFASKHATRQLFLEGHYFEWVLQKGYEVIAGRLATVWGLVRMFLTFNVGLTLFFAIIYYYFDLIKWTNNTDISLNIFHYIYYSGLTLTTLGYGDIQPKPSIFYAGLISIFQAMIGYLLLGLEIWGFTQFNTAKRPEDTKTLEKIIDKYKKELE